MASDYSPPPEPRPQPHPYLHEPLLHISNLPPWVRDEDLAVAFQTCAPFRPNIQRDGSNRPLSGTIEFKYLEKGEYPPRNLLYEPFLATSTHDDATSIIRRCARDCGLKQNALASTASAGPRVVNSGMPAFCGFA